MTAPHRVRLSRAKGWRMPENTVKVDRTTKWGKPMLLTGCGFYAQKGRKKLAVATGPEVAAPVPPTREQIIAGGELGSVPAHPQPRAADQRPGGMTDRRPSGMLAVELIRLWAETSGLSVHENVLAGTGAVFSGCGTWRYLLWRGGLGSAPLTGFAMLNPSTADHNQDDPTIRRCLGFAPGTGLLVWNLFAVIATHPHQLRDAVDPVGPKNDDAMVLALGLAAPTIAAWGVHGVLGGREHAVRRHVAAQGGRLQALKLTKEGHPGHPLYLPGSARPQPWDFDW